MFFKANFRTAIVAIIIGMVSILPSRVFAIGLGEIQLNSSLNEPLNAEIQLLQVRGLSENDILIGIAPKADFEAAGVDRLFFLTSLKFSLELNNPKGPLVRIKTDAPVREPYLNFLLEVQWPSGRLLREYTLLMDLPAMSGTATARVIKGAQAPAPAVEQKPAAKLSAVDANALEAELAEVDAKSVVAASPIAVPAAPATTGEASPPVPPVKGDETQSGETASEPMPIVNDDTKAASAQQEEKPAIEMTKPASEEPLQYTPADKQVANDQVAPVIPVYPTATTTPAEGDYTSQKGDSLWLIAMKYRQKAECNSQEHECSGVTVQQTMLTMQRLNPDAFMQGNINLLKKGKVLRMPTYDDLTEVTSKEAFAEVRRQNIAWSGDPNGHKNAAPVEQIDATHQESPAVEAPADTEEGHLKLSVPGSKEGSATGKASGAEAGKAEALQNELSIAMEELDRNKREKAVITDQISALNDQANTMKQMLEVRNAELAAMQAALAKKQQAPVEAAASAPAPDAQVVEPAAVNEAPAPKEEAPVTAPTAPVVTPAPANEVTSASPGILSRLQDNLVWLLGGVLTLVLVVVAVIKLRNRKPAVNAALQHDDLDEEQGSIDRLDEDSTHEDKDEASEDSFEMDEDLFEEAPAAEAKPETSDAIGEADIYISFGTYDKAESLLKSAIASEPKRTDLRLKLLEVYVGMENLAAFDKQFNELNNLRDAGATERAREMRNRISGASPEDSISSAPTALSPAVSDDLDFDLDLADDKPVKDSGLDLDFDLDLDLGEELKEDSTMKSPKVSMSDAPTVQQRALDISEMKTAVTPAVKVAEANTAMRESIDLDLSGLDAELKEFDSIPDAAPATKASSSAAYAIANDAPTPKTDLDEEFDFLADADEAATKLDLARAYIDMGDKEGAKDILEEVIEEGQDAQKTEARKLLAGIS